jgi:hypothetical protein
MSSDPYSIAAFLGAMEILGTMESMDFVCDALESELRPKPAINCFRCCVALVQRWIQFYVAISSWCSNLIQQRLQRTFFVRQWSRPQKVIVKLFQCFPHLPCNLAQCHEAGWLEWVQGSLPVFRNQIALTAV